MNQECRGLFTTGSFATATRLSLKALRLYNQLGLLMPRYVDPETGYRYYHADQLDHARLIRMLRAMEMPLAAIRQVLAATSADAEQLVHAHVRAPLKPGDWFPALWPIFDRRTSWYLTWRYAPSIRSRSSASPSA